MQLNVYPVSYTHLRENTPSLTVNLLFIIRSLERIGDIAKTIAATVVFRKEATDIRHGKEK